MFIKMKKLSEDENTAFGFFSGGFLPRDRSKNQTSLLFSEFNLVSNVIREMLFLLTT